MQTIKLSDSSQIRALKKLYISKKNQITQRLKEFDIFYSQPYSWFYNSGEMELRNGHKDKEEKAVDEKKDDERLFGELCFCILTANTSAEMGLKAIDSIRGLLINGTAE